MSFITVDLKSLSEFEDLDASEYAGLEEVEVNIPILSDAEYKVTAIKNYKMCLHGKSKPKEVPTYYPYSTSRDASIPRGTNRFPRSYMLATFLMTSFNLNMSTSFRVIKLLNSFNKRALDRSIVYKDNHLNLKKVPINIRAIFDNTKVITDKYATINACVIVKNELLKEMSRFIKVVNNLAPSAYSGNNTQPIYRNLMSIPRDEFLQMSATSRLRILSQTVQIKNNTLRVALNIKKDIGNLGREYHLLANIPRDDRAKISALYGYDFESALQVIVLAIMQDINSSIKIGITQNFVQNKNDVRQYVVDILGVNMDLAKKVITAAYQGGGLGSVHNMIGHVLTIIQKEGMKDLYEETKIIIIELLKISDTSFIASNSVLGSHFTAARWYASKRTATRWELTKDFTYADYQAYVTKYSKAKAFKFAKSYMFYLWTYFEGEARKILATHLKQPISLHDAVYTQDKVSFNAMNVAIVEAEILQKIGIPLKLGPA